MFLFLCFLSRLFCTFFLCCGQVYSVLTLQFLVTVGMAAAAAYVDPIRQFVVDHTWLMYIGLAVAFACVIALFCFKQRYPLNVVLLALFTLAYGFTIAVIVAQYFEAGAGKIVLEAAALTALVFIVITFIAVVSKIDFSFLRTFLFAAFVVLIAASIANFVFGFVAGKRSRLFTFGISVLGALVFIGFLLYDTSLVLKRLGPDQWIQACISLYLDVANIFMYMLNIVSFASN